MLKLTGNKRKVLKCIYKNNGKYTRFNLYNYVKFVSKDEVSLHIESLRKDNYICLKGLNDNLYLTSQGYSYFKNETADNFETCIKSIICPIIVSFLTTLLTLWLKDL